MYKMMLAKVGSTSARLLIRDGVVFISAGSLSLILGRSKAYLSASKNAKPYMVQINTGEIADYVGSHPYIYAVPIKKLQLLFSKVGYPNPKFIERIDSLALKAVQDSTPVKAGNDDISRLVSRVAQLESYTASLNNDLALAHEAIARLERLVSEVNNATEATRLQSDAMFSRLYNGGFFGVPLPRFHRKRDNNEQTQV